MIEYLMISGVIMGLLVVLLLLVNTNIMEDPANRLVYVAFTDIGNGVSTRMVDVYAIAPVRGQYNDTALTFLTKSSGEVILLKSDPVTNPVDQDITVSRGYLQARISLAGIGATRGVTGNTTGAGINRISYDSERILMMAQYNQRSNDRGVSESIGFLLIFTIVIVGIGLVTLYGYPLLLKQQVSADEKIMEKNMIVLQNDVKSLAYKTVPYKETSLKIGSGSLTVYNSSYQPSFSNITINDSGQSYIS